MSDSGAEKEHPLLVVSIDGQPQLEYDRRKPVPEAQMRSLERMDQRMDGGLRLGIDWIEHPDIGQRAQFIAMHLLAAMQQQNESSVAASCAWLATRLPDLKQVRAKMLGAGFSVELVFDRPYVPEQRVSFVPRPGS